LTYRQQFGIIELSQKELIQIKTLKNVFEKFFTKLTSQEKLNRDFYNEWQYQRDRAHNLGRNHVDEIDAIFRRYDV
tara:strand:+ start:295 stop:522 length:228 start_codon:yes stop_codon:yes gene_type:complete